MSESPVVANLPKRRDDILVSICITDMVESDEAFEFLKKFADNVDRLYRFREIVVVVDNEKLDNYLPLVHKVANLRLFTVDAGLSSYRKRVISASEAIGDVVLISDLTELKTFDSMSMVKKAVDEGRAIVGERPKLHGVNRLLSGPFRILGRSAGFNVSLSNTRTLALPRTVLNQVLKHQEPELALRFLPLSPPIPFSLFVGSPTISLGWDAERMSGRLVLLNKLLVFMAPRVLNLVTLGAALLGSLGAAFAIYVLGVWLFIDDIAPGWLTTSMMLSLTAVFLGTSVFGLSIGPAALNRLSDHDTIRRRGSGDKQSRCF